MKRSILLAIAICLAISAYPLRASVITLPPVRDGTLYQDDTGETANGSGLHLFAGATEFGNIRRAVMAFDVAGNLPAGSTINSVSLTMNMSRCGPTCGTPVTMGLHDLLADWGEGTSVAEGQEGIPAQAETNDATWIYNFYADSVWANPGGDFNPAISASQIISGVGSYTWATTPQMVADVQSWLNSPITNYGWLMQGGEDIATTAKRFDSRESSHAPQLTINYSVPEPSTILFVSAGMIAIARFRRRPK